MRWPPPRKDLERAREELERMAGEGRRARVLEPLARTLRLLGDEPGAQRLFREAAADVERVIARYPEREAASRWAQMGTLLLRAGDAEAARPWHERALRSERDPAGRAALRYLLGDYDRAAAEARTAADDPDDRPYPYAEALEVLAIARRDGDTVRAARAREAWGDMVRSDHTPPWEESGTAALSLSEWYEEAVRTEAELDGSAVPALEMARGERGWLTRAKRERARDGLLRTVEEDPWWSPLEQLARAHRWLGEEDEARRRFGEAAADEETAVVVRPARVAVLRWLARDEDAARSWLQRALGEEGDRTVLATLHYLAGDHAEAARLAREAAEDPDDRPYPLAEAIEVLASARRERSEDRLPTRACETFADLMKLDRTPPWKESGAVGLTLSDWLFEGFRTEAEILGDPLGPIEELLYSMRLIEG